MIAVSILMVLAVGSQLPTPTLSFCCEPGVEHCGGRCMCCDFIDDVPLNTCKDTCRSVCATGETTGIGQCGGGQQCCKQVSDTCKDTCRSVCATGETTGIGQCGGGQQCCKQVSGTCPAPFKQIGSEYLYFHDTSKKNWDDALSHCKSIGGSLAEPANMDDFITLIESSYSHMKYDIWLGATDRSTEQDWKWLSGGSVSSSLWPAWPGNQPDGDGDCMQIHYHGYSGFFLNDYICTVKGYFVCECTPQITTGCNGKCSTSRGSGYCKDACNRGEERLGSCTGGKCSCCRKRVSPVCAGICTLRGGQRGFCSKNCIQNPRLEADLRLSLIPAPSTCNKGCSCCPIGISPIQ